MEWPSSSPVVRRCPQYRPPLVRTVGSPRRVGRHGGTVQRVRAARRVDVLAVHVLGAGAEGGAVLAAGVLLLDAVEFEFCGGDELVQWPARGYLRYCLVLLDCSFPKSPISTVSSVGADEWDGSVVLRRISFR